MQGVGYKLDWNHHAHSSAAVCFSEEKQESPTCGLSGTAEKRFSLFADNGVGRIILVPFELLLLSPEAGNHLPLWPGSTRHRPG